MNGYPVVVWVTELISPRQKRVAMSIPKPRLPFNITEKIMAFGITTAAFSISSAMRNECQLEIIAQFMY